MPGCVPLLCTTTIDQVMVMRHIKTLSSFGATFELWMKTVDIFSAIVVIYILTRLCYAEAFSEICLFLDDAGGFFMQKGQETVLSDSLLLPLSLCIPSTRFSCSMMGTPSIGNACARVTKSSFFHPTQENRSIDRMSRALRIQSRIVLY